MTLTCQYSVINYIENSIRKEAWQRVKSVNYSMIAKWYYRMWRVERSTWLLCSASSEFEIFTVQKMPEQLKHIKSLTFNFSLHEFHSLITPHKKTLQGTKANNLTTRSAEKGKWKIFGPTMYHKLVALTHSQPDNTYSQSLSDSCIDREHLPVVARFFHQKRPKLKQKLKTKKKSSWKTWKWKWKFQLQIGRVSVLCGMFGRH